jgi:hypothetical protein
MSSSFAIVVPFGSLSLGDFAALIAAGGFKLRRGMF